MKLNQMVVAVAGGFAVLLAWMAISNCGQGEHRDD